MKSENQSRKTIRNMETKSISRVSKQITPVVSELTDLVVDLISSRDEDDLSSVRDVLNENHDKLQNIISSNHTTQKSTGLKRNKDPLAPKRGKTSYIFFCVDKRDEIKNSNPDMSATDIIKELGRVWRSLSDVEKEPYIQLSSEDKDRYNDEMADYVVPDNIGFVESKTKTKRSGPKRGLTSYIYFCKDYRDILKNSNPELSNKEITSSLGKKWGILSDKEKAPFIKLAAIDKIRYENEKKNWTENSATLTTSRETTKTNVPVKATAKTKATTKTKTTVKAKEANASKKQLSGYLLFCQEERDEIMEEHPKWSTQRITKELGKSWKGLSDEEQADYDDRTQVQSTV